MYGQPPRFHRGGGGGNHSRQSVPPSPNAAVGFQNPNAFPLYGSHIPNANAASSAWQFQNSFGFNPQQRPQTQNPNNFPMQNATGFVPQQQHPQTQNPNNFPVQNAAGFVPQQQRPQTPSNKHAIIGQADRAAASACRDLIAAGESVTAWKVSQNALLALQVDSWNSLGIKMQQVPSLHRLMFTEGKVNAFVHCFVGVQRITSLYDLKVAICRNESVDDFEALGLGPFLRHPLVMHYFSIRPDFSEVFKITGGEIVHLLSEFLDESGDREIKVEEFLEFISKRRSVQCKEWLGIRVQSLGMHISAIREAKNCEKSALDKCVKTLRSKSEKLRKHPIPSSQKQQLDERFSVIAQRVESFASVEKSFCGKHTRFVSSSSEDEDSDCSTEDDQNNDIITGSWSTSTSKFGKSSERVSTCPYPSATEEMERLCGKSDTQGPPHASCCVDQKLSGPLRKKRKSENGAFSKSAPSKLLKKGKTESFATRIEKVTRTKAPRYTNKDLSITNDSLQMFVTTWKEACRDHTVDEVLEKMLQFYNVRPKQRKKTIRMFSSYPLIGLLNAAVSSIKSGTWNSIYDNLQAISHNELPNSLTTSSEYETIDVGPSIEHVPVVRTDNVENIKDSLENTKCVSAEDVVGKIATYIGIDNEVDRNYNSPLQCRIMLLRKFCNLENWVAKQFGVKDFNALGFGDFLQFLENFVYQLPRELLKLLVGGTCGSSSLEVCMSSNQFAVLLSQALSSLWEKERVTKQMISMLLMRQFPLVGFELMENGALEDFLDTVREQKSCVTSKCVLFSASMIEKCHFGDSLIDRDNSSKITPDRSEMRQKIGSETVTTKNAIEVLLKAPLLSDLSKWSHWDVMFAPFLGSLISWLLNDVNTKELLCLVTKDGKVLRLDHSATPDSFLEAAVQGSSFQTAVNFLSLFSLVGGEKYIPLSLLKCHAQHAFEVMFRNLLENIEISDGSDFWSEGSLCKMKMAAGISTTKVASGIGKHMDKMSRVVSILSRFILDCLGYLPSEFHIFATDVLLSGMKSVFKDAASAILCECSNMEQRLILHEVGLSMGISEWINDYNAIISNDASDLSSASVPCIDVAKTEKSTGLKHDENIVEKFSVPKAKVAALLEAGRFDEGCEKSTVESISGCQGDSFQHDEDKDAALVIESIRRDEFGLDPNLSDVENHMLKKQHARLGRALHCLSQELYSQDSHFILELVQNADDNNYSENVEPTLIFILQDSDIVVLNNERGFSAQNMRALCDVGNSTKKGSNAGYIGKKGIGFKSVFRVTDSPEIHSNGFHVKFDISEGQIGFVLPSVVPPCDIGLLSRMASADTDSCYDNHWNTCIVLPFRSHLSEGTVMSSIMTMFSDLHPSLLLFLHRLKCIKLRNLLNDTLIVMKKEILGDGIIKVSHGKEKMTWFVVSQKLQTNSIRFDVQTTEISMAFTLKESDNGYAPCLDQQPVFAYLPLRTYGLKFILQGDFVLPSSREEVDGDSPWNQWLLSEYPNLFVRAQREFCALPCFRSDPGRGLSAFMSFVPLVGEVHGFFSSLPRLVISKLRMMNCLLVEGDNSGWAPPCKVLRGWTDQVRSLLPDNILLEHLGLRYLDKNIVLSDTLARALGIEEFGPNVFVRVLSSLCHTQSGIKSMGMSWLASCLNTLYVTIFNSSGSVSANFEIREDILRNLQKTSFIPLSDGTYSSVDEGTIWLQSNISTGFDGPHNIKAFPNIFAKLRTVNPSLFSTCSSDTAGLNVTFLDNVTRLLQSIGVQQLSVHDVVKQHILPALSDGSMANKSKLLMVEYICFLMLHLKSTCSDCLIEKEHIISELQCKSLLLTNCGFKCSAEVPIHFCAGFGNPVNSKKLADFVSMRWHEIDISYLKHPVNESLSSALMKWREFFEKIGVTDFAQVVQVDKSVADVSDATFKHELLDKGLISPDSRVKDWESPELLHLVSLLSKSGNRENCKYLLEVLDTLWDACYSDKTTGFFYPKSGENGYPFKSAFIYSLCDTQWVASTMDEELHYPKDLFYNCEAVQTILGSFAPYAVPKVNNERLVNDLGLKTRVSLADVLDVLRAWRKSSKSRFQASIRQMSKLYALVWNEMATSKQNTMEDLKSGPFIFVPFSSVSSSDDVVFGTFFNPNEVYWHDSTGSVQEWKDIHSECISSHSPMNKSLCTIYPGLRGFFVEECGVQEAPPLRSYIQILLQLSSVTSPSQAADKSFQVFLKWADGLNSSLLSFEDVIYLKECLSKLEFRVLPTVQDRWVSLHPSFGLVCWCDDMKLKKEFKNSNNIDFLYFGELTEEDKEKVQEKVSNLMKNLGIPAISEVVTREAIYYGLADCSLKESLINWTLPYVQRYIHKLHSARYVLLKQSNFETVKRLKIIVVQKLFYRNVIKSCDSASKKRVECTCLLQENILYTTEESDYHSLFMELSRLFFDGTSEFHMANFLHMITTMAESGSSKEQVEFFILNSQKIPKLPEEESVWELSPVVHPEEASMSHPSDHAPLTNEQIFPRRKAVVHASWPPVDWKTAPDFNYARANGLKTQPSNISSYSELKDDNSESITARAVCAEQGSVSVDCNMNDDPAAGSVALVLHETYNLEDQSNRDVDPNDFTLHAGSVPVCLGETLDEPLDGAHTSSSPAFSMRDRLQTGTFDAAQAMATGRIGEHLAYKYFVGKVGKEAVKWVNEVNETGLPYDIVIGDGTNEEYIEVKATRSPRKDWFNISLREWQFATNKPEYFSIAFVAIMENNVAKVTVFKDPVKLCQQGVLQLVLMMPRQLKQLSLAS